MQKEALKVVPPPLLRPVLKLPKRLQFDGRVRLGTIRVDTITFLGEQMGSVYVDGVIVLKGSKVLGTYRRTGMIRITDLPDQVKVHIIRELLS